MSRERNKHHAYLLVGVREKAYNLIDEILGGGFKLRGNPDFFIIERESLGIDDVRKLREMSIQKAFGEMKVFLILSSRYTIESQNALLKTLEEPPPNTHYFLTIDEKETLIPTLLSRVEILRVGTEGERGAVITGAEAG